MLSYRQRQLSLISQIMVIANNQVGRLETPSTLLSVQRSTAHAYCACYSGSALSLSPCLYLSTLNKCVLVVVPLGVCRRISKQASPGPPEHIRCV